MKRIKETLALSIVCLLLTMAIVIQVKTVKDTNEVASQTLTNNELRDQVLRWKEKYDNANKDLQESEENLSKAREQASLTDDSSVEKQNLIKTNSIILGLTDVKGTGVVVSLADNQNVKASTISVLDNIEYYLVHDGDLLTIINELKNAGAEAISVNGKRVISTTAISCEGTVIEINGEKIGSPFEIKAIGSSELLYGALIRPGGYLELLNETGIKTDIKKNDEIFIPKYSGIIKLENIKNVD